MFRRTAKAAILLAALVFLIACSPRLDWRTVQSPQERYTALFPGKPEKMERKIPYEGEEFAQTLQAVKIDDDIYSVSTIQLPANQGASLNRLISQLQANLIDGLIELHPMEIVGFIRSQCCIRVQQQIM